jgi:hypothetical protein
MKTKHLFWGFLFLTLGTLILLNNVTSFTLYWINIWRYWPVFLILIGISLIIKEPLIRGAVVSITAIIIGISIFAALKTGWGFFEDNIVVDVDNGIDIREWNDGDYKVKTFDEEYNDNIKKASLSLKVGVGSFKITGTTPLLFTATTKGYNNKYSLSRMQDGERVKLFFERREKKFFLFNGKNKNKVDISLNDNPVWDLNLDVGAAATEFDLRAFKIDNVDIDIGAASLKVYLGDKNDTTNVRIDAGASSVEVMIPEDVGCEVKANITLSSKDFDNFTKISKKLYRTENFESTEKKIFLDIESGVSSVKIKRYSTGEWL